ncbi:MAG: T9SS type A sorting domain-containing protein, partial [Chitinophagales bacterium]
LDYCMGYNNDYTQIGIPTEPIHYYNYLHSIFKDGKHLTYGGDGYNGSHSTNYFLSGDPSDPYGFSQCHPYGGVWDYRMILSSGPFTFHPDEVKTFDIAVVWTDTVQYPFPSFSYIESNAATAENYFSRLNFQSTICSTIHTVHAVNVIPNPVAHGANISFTASCAEKIMVYDCSGRFCFETKIQDQSLSQINTKGWSDGIYFYKVIFPDGEVNGKFLVQ